MALARPLSEEERRNAIQTLANYVLFERAGALSIECIVQNAVLEHVAAGTILLYEGCPADQVYFVLSGVVRVYHTAPDGRQFTPKIMRAPNHFGDLELLAGAATNGQSVAVVSQAVVARVPWSAIRRCLREDHLLCLAWLSGISSQFVYTIDADRHNVFSGLTGRIANVLLSYADVFGRRTRRGIALDVELSRGQLANQVGSVKRAVVRVVQDLIRRGALADEGEGLLVKDPERLLAETLPRRIGITHSLLDAGDLQEELP
jgi:CRP/FNR family transcriptional regulator